MLSTFLATRRPLLLALTILSLGLLGTSAEAEDPLPASRASGCEWVPGFHAAGIYRQTPEVLQSVVRATVIFDDGSGPALLVAGEFYSADEKLANGIAKWNGQSWTALASSPVESPRYFALAVYNDGGGNALYAGGSFGIRKWNGTSWSNLGAGVDGSVSALTVFGSVLVVGGTFTTAGGSPAANIARWNGTTWSVMGSGMNGGVYALLTWNDGGGDRLYAGGSFSTAGGVAAKKIARWNGSWSALGAGVDDGSTGGAVSALAVFDDGGGSDLYVGGSFVNAGGSPAANIARWSGTEWSALGAGIGGDGDGLSALTPWNDGIGNALYAAGIFTTAGGSSIGRNIAKWNGTTWSALGDGLRGIGTSPGVYDLTVFDDGGGSALYAGGDFLDSGPLAVRDIARWNGSAWSGVTRSPYGQGLEQPITAMTIHDDGTGPAIFAAGDFWTAGETASQFVSKWNGRQWNAIGDGGSPLVAALASYDDGNGAALYLGTAYVTEFPPQTGDLRKWSGGVWSVVPGEVPPLRALGVFDDGTDAVLVASGTYFLIDTDFDSDIAQFDGITWSAMGAGIFGDVDEMLTFDDGNGPALYIGGDFLIGGTPPFGTGGIPAFVAKWDGANWSPLGTGLDDKVRALAAFDDGSGLALYAGGDFDNAGGSPAANLAKWDGASWSAVGGGMNNRIRDLAVFNDGRGKALYVSGSFTEAGGQPIPRLARWDGSAWTSVDGVAIVSKMITFDQGSAESLYFAVNGAVDIQGNLAHNFAQFCQPLSFADGFESGDASAWSQVVP
jgi:hypothetical protein